MGQRRETENNVQDEMKRILEESDSRKPWEDSGVVSFFNKREGYGFIDYKDKNGEKKRALIDQRATEQIGAKFLLLGTKIDGIFELNRDKGVRIQKIIRLDFSHSKSTIDGIADTIVHPCSSVLQRVFLRKIATGMNYGFFCAGDGKPDIFVHANLLEQFGIKSFEYDRPYLVKTEENSQGLKACYIKEAPDQ